MLAARAPRAPAPARPGPLVSRTASPLSAQDVLDRRVLERELRVHPLQLRVLGLQLPQPLQLVDRGARVLRPPMEVGRLADVVLPEDLGDRDPRLPCFRMLTIWLSVNRDFRMGISLAPESLPSNGLPGGEAYA